MLPIPSVEHDYFLNNDKKSIDMRKEQFMQYTIDGRGVFPISLFNSKSSYESNLNIFVGDSSYEDQIKSLVSFINNLGFNIYIRDVSFLGFPVYHVFIPEISVLGKKILRLSEIGMSQKFKEVLSVIKLKMLFIHFQKWISPKQNS